MKLTQIFDWMGFDSNYKNGVTNKQVLEHFGNDFKNAWNKLKRNKRCLYYEDGKWFRWENNRI